MTPDSEPSPRSTIEYARPGTTKVPEGDLEHAFGCFPAMGGALLSAWGWGCTVAAWSDPARLDTAVAVMALASSAAGLVVGVLVMRRPNGFCFGLPLILACAAPIAFAGRSLLGW